MTTSTSSKPFKRILLTGGAGGLGRALRDRIKPCSKAAHLGFRPRDSSAAFAERFPDSGDYPAQGDVTTVFQGGPFVLHGPKYR